MTISRDSLYCIILFLTLFFIAGFRAFNVGTDTQTYVNGFLHASSSIQNRNIGYNFFVDLIRNLTNEPRIFLLIVSFLIQYFTFKSISAHSKSATFALVIYSLMFYCLSLNLLRQFIVISVFYYFGIGFIIHKRFILFVLLVLILSTFHELSLVFFPLYFISDIKFKRSIYLITWISSLIVLFSNQISASAIFFKNIDAFLRIFLSNLPNYFSEVDSLTNTEVSLRGFIVDQIVFMYIYIQIFYKEKLQLSSKSTLLFNLYFLGLILQNLFFFVETIQRVSLMYSFAAIFVCSEFIVKPIPKTCYLLLMIIIFYVRFVQNGIGGVF